MDRTGVRAVGLDETSSRRGQENITLFGGFLAKRLVFTTPGRDAETTARFADKMCAYGGDADAIQKVSMDLHPVFQKGTRDPPLMLRWPSIASIGRSWLTRSSNRTKGEAHSHPNLKQTRWIWFKNADNLREKERVKLGEPLNNPNLKTAQDYQFRQVFQWIFTVGEPLPG